MHHQPWGTPIFGHPPRRASHPMLIRRAEQNRTQGHRDLALPTAVVLVVMGMNNPCHGMVRIRQPMLKGLRGRCGQKYNVHQTEHNLANYVDVMKMKGMSTQRTDRDL